MHVISSEANLAEVDDSRVLFAIGFGRRLHGGDVRDEVVHLAHLKEMTQHRKLPAFFVLMHEMHLDRVAVSTERVLGGAMVMELHQFILFSFDNDMPSIFRGPLNCVPIIDHGSFGRQVVHLHGHFLVGSVDLGDININGALLHALGGGEMLAPDLGSIARLVSPFERGGWLGFLHEGAPRAENLTFCFSIIVALAKYTIEKTAFLGHDSECSVENSG